LRKTFTSNTSLAYFEIHEENRAEEDTEYNNNLPPNALVDWAYVGIKAKTKGYEVEISGELPPGWQGKGWQDVYNSGKGVTQEFSQAPYWLVDLIARYQVSKNISASVNVNNVLDKKYFTNIGF
jgi:outer membrane receptor for ferric coprogen and ferric-rhodotorulic acid